MWTMLFDSLDFLVDGSSDVPHVPHGWHRWFHRANLDPRVPQNKAVRAVALSQLFRAPMKHGAINIVRKDVYAKRTLSIVLTNHEVKCCGCISYRHCDTILSHLEEDGNG